LKYDTIIVGAGISGLLSALMCSKEGDKVLVLEKEEYIGGNARSYVVDGYHLDVGAHAITHVDDGPLRIFMNEYFDVVPKFIPYGEYYVRTKKKLTPFPWTVAAWVNFDVLPKKDRIQITKELGASITYSIFGWSDTNVSLYDYLKHCNLSDKTWKFINTLSYFMSGKNMKKTPAWRMLKGARYFDENEGKILSERLFGHLSKMKKLVSYHGAYHQAYPSQGVGAIIDAIKNSFPEGMVKIQTKENVEDILVKDNKVYGVSSNGKEYHAEKIIYSGYVRLLPEMVENLSKEYVKKVKTLESTGSITLWLGIKDKFKTFDYQGSEIWFEEGKPFWAMPITSYNKALAPKGRFLVAFSAIVEDDILIEEKQLRDTIGLAYPGIWENVVFEHKQVTVPEKAAITTKSVFPGQKTPIKGLYTVGTDTDIRSMGITRAAFSVIELRKILYGK